MNRKIVFILIFWVCVVSPISALECSAITNSLNITKISEIQTGGAPVAYQIVNDLMYIADHAGLFIYNISDLENPIQVSHCSDLGASHGIAVITSYAFIADLDYGLEVYNVTNPLYPSEIATYNYGEGANELAICNTTCFLLTNTKFISLNITDPLNVSKLYEYSIDGLFGLDLFITDSYAFITIWPSNLLILDISDPLNMQFFCEYDLDSFIRAFDIDQEYLYAACRTNGFKIYSIRNLSTPELIGEYTDVGDEYGAYGVCKYNNYALICDYDEGIKAIEISDPTAPYLSGSYAGSDFFGISTKENYAFFVTGDVDNSIQIVELIENTSVSATISPILIVFVFLTSLMFRRRRKNR
jgi:hypothetical protein